MKVTKLLYMITYTHPVTGEDVEKQGELDLTTYRMIGKYIAEDVCGWAYDLADKGYYRVYFWRVGIQKWEYIANSYTDFENPRRKWINRTRYE